MSKGLTSKQAEELLQKHGPNIIERQKKKSLLFIFLGEFNNFLTLLLMSAAGLSLFIGELVDGLLIIGIVILNALFGMYQEKKAEEAIEALSKMTVTKVRVIRDGVEQEIDSKYLVPGDIIYIEEGTKVPADGTVFDIIQLEVNEAALTGESLPVQKKNEEEIYMGTIITKGRSFARVTATGLQTKFGQIASHLSEIKEPKTPLEKKLEELSRFIGIIGIALSAIVFLLSVVQGATYFPSFLLAISLAVAVVPEGLPAVLTITLSIGVKEMARKKAIVRKLSAVEALGSVTLIATDKTGTLTTNKMTVKEVFVDGKERDLSIEINDSLLHHSKLSRSFSELLKCGVICSSATILKKEQQEAPEILGDPTEGSVIVLAEKAGLVTEIVRSEWKTVEEMPFDSVSKRMSVIAEKNGEYIQYIKGAPESVIELCNKILIGDKEEPLTKEKIDAFEKTFTGWAEKGLRVLAFAYKPRAKPDHHYKEKDKVLLGMVAIYDAPRPEAKEAIQRAYEAGISVVMITGDNEKTAQAIGSYLGLLREGDEVVTGKDVEAMNDEELLKRLPQIRIFARTSPFHKKRIVALYQQLGEVVAVTGDGVNDSIALKQADVGLSMGMIGTDVARETSDIVITDDNFATIVNAIEQGRTIIRNVKNAVQYLLSCNVSEALALIGALSLGIPDLFFAIQLLYINLVTDGLPALALAFSPREEGIMKRPPERELSLLKRHNIEYIFSVGVIAALIVLLSYHLVFWLKPELSTNLHSRAAAFTVLALIQSFIFVDLWLSKKPLLKNLDKLRSGIFLAAFSMPFMLQLIIVKSPFLAELFKVATVPTTWFMGYIGLASFILVGIKITNSILRGNTLQSSTV